MARDAGALMISKSVYRTIPEQIVEQLRREILAGELEENQPLREKELSERFDVSRGPVRHALLQLTKEGLVVATPNVGVRVARHPSDQVLALVIDVRRRIEIFALEAFLKEASERDLTRLAAILEDLKRACAGDDISRVEEMDMLFHSTIVSKYGDKHLLDLWQSVVTRMMLRYTRFEDLMESYEEHKALFDAICAHDAKSAKRLLVANIQ
jgi:DNA-binding GntR family transcriptional regulator